MPVVTVQRLLHSRLHPWPGSITSRRRAWVLLDQRRWEAGVSRRSPPCHAWWAGMSPVPGGSTQALRMEVSQAVLHGAQRSRALHSPGEQRGGGRRLQGEFFPTLEATHGHIPFEVEVQRAGRGEPMGAGRVLGKDVINELIKGFSRLVAATEKEPHPGWSDAHPARPLSPTGLLHQALGTTVHHGLSPAAAAARELSHAACSGIARLGFWPSVFQVGRSCVCWSCCQGFLHNKFFCFI